MNNSKGYEEREEYIDYDDIRTIDDDEYRKRNEEYFEEVCKCILLSDEFIDFLLDNYKPSQKCKY